MSRLSILDGKLADCLDSELADGRGNFQEFLERWRLF